MAGALVPIDMERVQHLINVSCDSPVILAFRSSAAFLMGQSVRKKIDHPLLLAALRAETAAVAVS